MFEKSFEEYKKLPKWKGKIFMKDEETCYKDGAIFGYYAAKEECTGIATKRMRELADRIGWHYPSKGELPPSGQDVIIHNRKKYLIDRYYSDGDEWLYTKNEDVVAWYYLPELVKP